jgi:putative GTP pyrophosphokinase
LLRALATNLEGALAPELARLSHVDRCSFRVKDVEPFASKALREREGRREYNDPLAEIEDQVAGRILVHLRPDMGPAEEVVTRLWGTVEYRKVEPADAREFDYESEHYVFVIPDHAKPVGWDEVNDMPTTFEMQVRTLFMHAYAEPQHDWGYKGATELDRERKRQMAWIAASAWGADRAFSELRQSMEELSRQSDDRRDT